MEQKTEITYFSDDKTVLMGWGEEPSIDAQLHGCASPLRNRKEVHGKE